MTTSNETRLSAAEVYGREGADSSDQEAYVYAVSTPWSTRWCGRWGIPKSQVSRLYAEIDTKIAALLDRPLEGDWPDLWRDATYAKGRSGGCVVSVAVIIAVAVSGNGRREVPGLAIGVSEAETFLG
jgi:putative transposase